ncbi:MAG: hypothetical protein AB7S72_11255 [Draconibacterium sp.]
MVTINEYQEHGYVKYYFTSPYFTGRLKKHIGKGTIDDFADFKVKLLGDLRVYFARENPTKESLSAFVDDTVKKLKFGTNIFDYVPEFIERKRNTINRHTNKPLSQSNINSYTRAIELFKRMLIEKRLKPIPEIIDEQLLNEFMSVRKRFNYNYLVKLHTRLKSFISYLEYKNLPIDKSYHHSNFSEIYDNQQPADDDVALSVEEVLKLIKLREKYRNDLVKLPVYKTAKTLSKELQAKQKGTKLINLKRVLDCFLYMIATGMYVTDVNDSTVQIFPHKEHPYLNYRRAKNSSLCKAVPVNDFECFIGGTLIKEYGVRSGSNFPLNLTVNTFNRHLELISEQANLGFVLKSKMARKTFATLNHFNFGVALEDWKIRSN